MAVVKEAYEIGELDQYYFGKGNHYEIYKKKEFWDFSYPKTLCLI